MKKVAICFSGHIRNFFSTGLVQLRESINALSNSGHQVDCFFSIWDTLNTQTAHYVDADYSNVEFYADQLDSLNLKMLEVEHYNDLKHNFYLKNFHPTIQSESPHIISSDGILYSTPMFYKIYKCNLLKKTFENTYNFQYDVVFRYRANIQLLNQLDVDHVTDGVMYNAGHHTPWSRGLGYTHESLMTQDMFFYGSSPIMDIVCNLYPNLASIIANHGSTGPERLLYDWCFLENKLDHKVSPIQFNYDNNG